MTGVDGDGRRGTGKVPTEAREPVDQVLAGWKRHVGSLMLILDRAGWSLVGRRL